MATVNVAVTTAGETVVMQAAVVLVQDTGVGKSGRCYVKLPTGNPILCRRMIEELLNEITLAIQNGTLSDNSNANSCAVPF